MDKSLDGGYSRPWASAVLDDLPMPCYPYVIDIKSPVLVIALALLTFQIRTQQRYVTVEIGGVVVVDHAGYAQDPTRVRFGIS